MAPSGVNVSLTEIRAVRRIESETNWSTCVPTMRRKRDHIDIGSARVDVLTYRMSIKTINCTGDVDFWVRNACWQLTASLRYFGTISFRGKLYIIRYTINKRIFWLFTCLKVMFQCNVGFDVQTTVSATWDSCFYLYYLHHHV